MMIGVYGDLHITKNMRSLQGIWEDSIIKSMHHMYNKFDELNIELAVCLGDFFDAPRIEAKHMHLVLPILEEINSKTYPTYILLGNHEAESIESNILEFIVNFNNIIPVTNTMYLEDMLFIPYYDNPSLHEMKNSSVVFTHHDIYGSSLSSGKTTAYFGLDPMIFKDAKLVMNGHVHLKSRPSPNIINTGSLLVSQQGELRVGDYPSYYILDTKTAKIEEYENKYSMIFLTIEEEEAHKLSSRYESESLVLKVEYEGEIPKDFEYTDRVSWRKKISSIGSKEDFIVSSSNFDMKNYLTDYIKKDIEVPDDKKEEYINTGLEVLG